jgi:hypothetical protein
MRYVIVDLDGASRAYFDTRGHILKALRDLEDETPGIAAELHVVTYDDSGARIRSPEPADSLLGSPVLDWSDVMPPAPPADVLIGGTVAHTRTAPTRPQAGPLSVGASTGPAVVPA